MTYAWLSVNEAHIQTFAKAPVLSLVSRWLFQGSQLAAALLQKV